MFTLQQPKRRIWPFVLAIFFVIILASGWYVKTHGRMIIEKIITSGTVKNVVAEYTSSSTQKLFFAVPELLGFHTPRTYLVLFLNNTELRPGGGFIGAYATIRVDKGAPEVLKVEGTEVLDKQAPKEWKLQPPQPLTDQLKVDRWYFRDSNWSPDFAESSKQALFSYTGERGVAAENIDAVIGVTPTVLEALLRKIGPVTVDNITFTADNVTETLEHEVEYGYDDRGIEFHNRKQILSPFLHEILSRVQRDVFTDIPGYLALFKQMAEEKHILAYSEQFELKQLSDEYLVSGRLRDTVGDYLLWVDANLAALKTDYAIERSLSYTIIPKSDGTYQATAKMTYKHTGGFDWRTTRYRTYARIFVPTGSTFVSADGAMKTDRSTVPGTVDQGVENGKQWFGTFISIEPGTEKSLSFHYFLPSGMVKQGEYSLLVDKQAGTILPGLTLSLNFGTTIQSATPPEPKEKWGDGKYEVRSDLGVNREFTVSLKH